MSKIPTAEEFTLHQTASKFLTRTDIKIEQHYYLMIEFTKLHVKAALKEALKSIPCLGSSTDIATYEEVEKSVLNAYPLKNIK